MWVTIGGIYEYKHFKSTQILYFVFFLSLPQSGLKLQRSRLTQKLQSLDIKFLLIAAMDKTLIPYRHNERQ